MLANSHIAAESAPSLLAFLKERVTCIEALDAPKLSLYVLSDEVAAPEPRQDDQDTLSFLDFDPKRFRSEYLAQRNLILIYQASTIVLGLTTFEYAHEPLRLPNDQGILRRWSRAYVQYIDSTGLYTPRQNQSHLTKSLISAYFAYCQEVLKVNAIHLLATAKPSFLFAGSDLTESKKPLPGTKLVNWWIGVIAGFVKGSGSDGCVHVYSPTEEAEGSKRLRKRLASLGKTWSYGLPYDLKAPCADEIPLFDDDPKWRHFEASIQDDDEILEAAERSERKRPRIIDDDDDDGEDNASDQLKTTVSPVKCRVTVRQFFESMQVRPEFRADTCAFMVIRFPDRLRDLAPTPLPISKPSDLASFGCKMLAGLTFESPDAAKKASQQLAGWMRLMGVKSSQVASTAPSLKLENNEALDTASLSVANSVQSLVKRKPLQPSAIH